MLSTPVTHDEQEGNQKAIENRRHQSAQNGSGNKRIGSRGCDASQWRTLRRRQFIKRDSRQPTRRHIGTAHDQY
jgi:hypothetical protein